MFFFTLCSTLISQEHPALGLFSLEFCMQTIPSLFLPVPFPYPFKAQIPLPVFLPAAFSDPSGSILYPLLSHYTFIPILSLSPHLHTQNAFSFLCQRYLSYFPIAPPPLEFPHGCQFPLWHPISKAKGYLKPIPRPHHRFSFPAWFSFTSPCLVNEAVHFCKSDHRPHLPAPGP